jgi:1-acyl-sn-glycerol-3-phosphate acyltransferase
VSVPGLLQRDRLSLRAQRAVGRALAPVLLAIMTLLMRFGLGWRIAGLAAHRARYRELRNASRTPLLICANHLTFVDSALIASALGSPFWYLTHFSALPWNLPERSVFAASRSARALAYVAKCIPISRGGDRRAIAVVLERAAWLLARGESVLVFPEGGRSRSGRVDLEATTYGVGRLVRAVPGCRVLCVYLRGEQQRGMSDYPVWGDRFHVSLSVLEPKSDHVGLRGAVELSRQVLERLAEMERAFEAGRQETVSARHRADLVG